MKPIIAVEFSAKGDDIQIMEESVPVHSPEEFFTFAAPGGGCERIPGEADEIRVIFLTPEHPNTGNPLADAPATLQLGMVLFNGPLSEIANTAEQIIDKAGRGELSASFLGCIGVAHSP